MHEENNCTCVQREVIEKITERLDEHEKQLSENATQFAVITTKLNLIMGILGTIGVGLVGILLNMLF